MNKSRTTFKSIQPDHFTPLLQCLTKLKILTPWLAYNALLVWLHQFHFMPEAAVQACEHFLKCQSPFHRRPAGFTASQSVPGRGLICPLPLGPNPTLIHQPRASLCCFSQTMNHITIEYYEIINAGLLDVAFIHTMTSPPSCHDERPYKQSLAKAWWNSWINSVRHSVAWTLLWPRKGLFL